MKVTREEVDKIAVLSRLTLTEEEREKFGKDLSEILAHALKIDQLDTADVPPTAHILHIHDVFRKDEVQPSMDREELLKNAPEQEDGCFIVPKVLE